MVNPRLAEAKIVVIWKTYDNEKNSKGTENSILNNEQGIKPFSRSNDRGGMRTR